MPHARPRHALILFKKKLAFARVISIQGCRQSGKSYLAEKLLPTLRPRTKYVSLDKKIQRDFARENPESFISSHSEGRPLVIDEAQKAPELFDEIKAHVDADPSPGRLVLLGSTEFSKELQIRESLTGRLSRLRLYSMNLGEALERGENPAARDSLLNDRPRISRKELLRHLDDGGFPGIFAVRSKTERSALLSDWVNLTVHHDLQQFPKIKIDPELALETLAALAQLKEPTAAAVASHLKKDTRRVQTILNALKILFVVHVISPHPLSTGKDRHYLCDPSLVEHFGGGFERKLETWFLHEQLSQRSYRDEPGQLHFYRTSKGSMIDFIVSWRAEPKRLVCFKILGSERFDERDLMVLRAFRKKAIRVHSNLKLFALGGGRISLKSDQIEIYPWESAG